MTDPVDVWSLDGESVAALRSRCFAVTRAITTRWRDNDSYGHVNNAVYYEYFDTAINSWLHEHEGADRRAVRMVAESRCRYLRELSFPGDVVVGITVSRVGTSSVTYDLAVFDGPEAPPAALGRWVHVLVDSTARRPIALSDPAKALLHSAAFLPSPSPRLTPSPQESS